MRAAMTEESSEQSVWAVMWAVMRRGGRERVRSESRSSMRLIGRVNLRHGIRLGLLCLANFTQVKVGASGALKAATNNRLHTALIATHMSMARLGTRMMTLLSSSFSPGGSSTVALYTGTSLEYVLQELQSVRKVNIALDGGLWS